ncbi:flagellar basal body-associated FliL family protein [Psychromonas sp. MME1]|uniref:flagellar basal body-associated FliL family protein n=1 Tax=Psychromonas sp. MME1 TaxID=3231032 RepID=UPI0034E26CB0
MADTDNNKETAEGEAVKEGGKKKLIIIIAAASILLLIIAAGAYFLFFNDSAEKEQPVVEQVVEEEVDNGFVENVYVPMPLPFVFNVEDGKRTRLVQIKVQLMVRNNEYALLTRKHRPLLEGTIVKVLSSATVAQLRSPEGKEALKSDSFKSTK